MFLSYASAAVSFLLKSNISFAFVKPINFGKVYDEQPSGESAIALNGALNIAKKRYRIIGN